MKNIRDQAIVLDMEYAETKLEPVSSRTPQFKSLHFSNITAETKQAIYINGLVEMPVEDISFNNIQFESETGILLKNANNVEFHNVRISTKEGPSLAAENAQNIIVDGVSTLTPVMNVALVTLTDVHNVFLYNNSPRPGSDIFVELKGAKTKDIHFKGNNFKYVRQPIIKANEVHQTINVE